MKATIPTIAACALLALSACAKEAPNSTDKAANEPKARDAAPGPLSETTPPSAPTDKKDEPRR
jgi:hypothetical protein